MSLSNRLGLLGRKVGMMRIFTYDGDAVPVTVIDVSNNRVTQVKTVDTDGYTGVQVAFGARKASRVIKPAAGHLAQARRRSRHHPEGIPGHPGGRHRIQARHRRAGEPVRSGPARRRARHLDRQGLHGHHQAPQLQLAARVARQQPFAQRAGLDLDGAGSGPRVPGQAHVGSHGRRNRHRAEPRHRPRRRGAFAPARPRCDPRFEERPCGRAPRRQGQGQEGSQLMQLELLNEQGQTTSKVDAPDNVFARDYNEALIHQLVVAFQANARQGTRSQKNREEVKHSTKKPWAQKGTGRARSGMTSSPIWRGGGRAFPNRVDENFTQKLNKKMYRAGMASILSQLARDGRLAVVDSFDIDAPKTKLLAQKFKDMSLSSVMVISDNVGDNLALASRNLPNVLVTEPRYADPLSLVFYKKVLVTKAAIEQ